MKSFHVRTGLILATVLVGSTAFAQAANRISNSRHNFQAGGTGNIKVTDASQEDGICVFCHTPHQGRSSLLLWNRQMTPGADYSWDVTHTTAGTQYPTNLKAWSGSSAKCLSCHDGTVSVGTIYFANAQVRDTPVGMTNNGLISGVYRIAGAQSGNGSDLSGNHPVGIPVPLGNTASTYNGLTNQGNIAQSRWQTLAVATERGVKIFGPQGGGNASEGQAGIECASCHDPHGTANPFFLRVTKANSTLCLSCHDK